MSVEACKDQIKQLQAQIDDMQRDESESPLREVAQGASVGKTAINLKNRRVLKGHFGKIYALNWSSDSRHLVSASQDGKLIVWNAFTTNKVHAIPLRSSWVMTCAYSPSGQFVACGGLDNLCTVYKVPEPGADAAASQKTYAELAQHEGYLSCCRFINDQEILTASGDSTCILWDIESKSPKSVFSSHSGDVMSIAVHMDSHTFVSGSCDATSKLWDHRAGEGCVKTFHGHESDINSVSFFPDGKSFCSGSDDSSIRMQDIRSYGQVQKFADDKILCGITSVAFSKTGKFLMAGYDDYNCYVWDTQLGEISAQLTGHENRVSCIGVSGDGKALATGSWDTLLKIWA